MQYTIRNYQPSDKEVVISLYSKANHEQVYPAFKRAMSHPVHAFVTAALCMTGYVSGGSSYIFALLAGGAWAGLVYYCCYDVFRSFFRQRTSTALGNIPAPFLNHPDNGFWLAEVEIGGESKVAGMGAIVGRRRGGGEVRGEHPQDRDGGGSERYGEIMCLIVAPWCRRVGVGYRLMQTALDFGEERQFSRIVLESTPVAVTLYRKLGFALTCTQWPHRLVQRTTMLSPWATKLSRITSIPMEKEL
ncbi:hypothetical protein AAFF_G00385900 [Aldrovandia affinis]|uniref:N-acetyltransferase domain-containing protein n=1 Tax=Aldrovandia affinis TaxID=143900 RepID=A0AAD7SF88_9TELE|nr:hypothetical protein AAFF_G00385900 [Aldrovandia affinis]